MKRTSPKLPQLQGLCRAGQFVTDAQAHATEALNPTPKKASRIADRILYVLVAVLVLAGLTQCTPSRQAAQQRHRDHRDEHAAPTAGNRYG